MLAAPNCKYPSTMEAISANTLHVTKQVTISIRHTFTFITLNLLTNLLAMKVRIPPRMNVYRKNSNATSPGI